MLKQASYDRKQKQWMEITNIYCLVKAMIPIQMEKEGYKQLAEKLNPRDNNPNGKHFLVFLCDNIMLPLKSCKVKLLQLLLTQRIKQLSYTLTKKFFLGQTLPDFAPILCYNAAAGTLFHNSNLERQ